MMAGQPRWYVAQTQPNAENKALAHLARQGFVTYLPRFLKRRRHARRIDVVAAPLFPRYLFIAIDMSMQRWRSVLLDCWSVSAGVYRQIRRRLLPIRLLRC